MEIIRRIRLDLMTPAEIAIYLAMQEVEKIGTDVKLTEAFTLLAKAKDLVADFVDKVDYDKEHDIHYYKCNECGRLQVISKESPNWLKEEVKIIHKRKDNEILCHAVYDEITKDEYFKLI